MSYHLESVREDIIKKGVGILCSKPGYDLKLSEISDVTGISAPVLYNYFSGIDEIRKEVFKRIEEEIVLISNLKLPNSVSPDMKIVTIGFNLVRHFEETGLSVSYLTEEKKGMPVDISELRENIIQLFRQLKNTAFEPDLCLNIFLSYITANISYYRKNGKKVPDDICDKALKLVVK